MEDFNLTDFLESFHSSPCREGGGAMAPCYKCKDEGIILFSVAMLVSMLSLCRHSEAWYSGGG